MYKVDSELGFVVVIAKSDNRGNGRKGHITLVCQIRPKGK
jgi:hypothetical protein